MLKNGDKIVLLPFDEIKNSHGEDLMGNTIYGISKEVFDENQGKILKLRFYFEDTLSIVGLPYIFPSYTVKEYNDYKVELI